MTSENEAKANNAIQHMKTNGEVWWTLLPVKGF